jgi:hypothetical protein
VVGVGDGIGDEAGEGVDVDEGVGDGEGDGEGVGDGVGVGEGVGVQFQVTVAGVTDRPFAMPVNVIFSAAQGKPESVTGVIGVLIEIIPYCGFTVTWVEEELALQIISAKGGICDALNVTLQCHVEP